MAESHSPAGLKVAWRRYHACSTGAWKPEATDTNAKHRNQGACITQSKRKCKWNRVPCRAGVDEWRCGCRCVVQVTRRVGDDEAIRAVRRADTDAPCGYRCAVRVTGQASSCAHILSHPLSAACRPVSPRRAYLSKVEAAQPLPRESSLGRPSGMISRGSYAILVWVDGIGIVRVSPLGAAVRAVSCRASPVCSRRARAYLV